MSDVSGAFGWWESVEELADAPPGCFDGSFFGLSEQGFELYKHHLDRVEAGAIRRQEEEMGAGGADRGARRFAFVAAEIVEDDDIAGVERWDELLLDPGGEGASVNRAVGDQRSNDLVMAQPSQEGQGLPVAEWRLADQLGAARRPAAQAGHVGLDPGLIDKDQSGRVQAMLVGFPARPQPRRPRPILFAGQQRFF